MAILTQFLLRLSFGLAVGMAVTSPDKVGSGFYRNHLYLTLGLTTLAALVSTSISSPLAWFAAIAAVLSYIGSVCWLYEAKRMGIAVLWSVAWSSFLAAFMGLAFSHEIVATTNPPGELSIPKIHSLGTLTTLSLATSGLVLGFTCAAMLLGHWYLNSPGMELAPLRRLLKFAAAAVGLQAFVSGFGLVQVLHAGTLPAVSWWMFILLRWSFGILGVAALIWMAWQTLKIPNTQSATGILYVAVIGVFVGELTALLLSAESAFPV